VILHNLTHRHSLLSAPGRGCFQFCTRRLGGMTRVSYAPYDNSTFHPVPIHLFPEIQKLDPFTPEAVMALIRFAPNGGSHA
jgi:hypothetical protein